MKVFRNLFGDGSKIHASEVVTKNAAGDVVGMDQAGMEMGKNTNGHYIRWNFGLQICWISPIVLTYTGAHILEKTWTFPKSFYEPPFCKPNAIDWAPNQGSRGLDIIAYAPSVSSARIVAHAIASGPFSSGDTWTVQAVAIGRWK